MGVSISLIIPVYNMEKYLVHCLESVIKQISSFDEIIIVNDGSTDNSLFICEKYMSKYKNFKLINQENKGLSAARNIGMNLASSEYVMFLDSDDYLRTDTVSCLKKELRKFHYDVIYFDTDIHCEDGCEVDRNKYDRSKAQLDGICMSGWEYFSRSYPGYCSVPVWMAVYRKALIDKANIKFPEGLYFEDNYFSFLIITYAKYVIHLSEKLYQRRYRANSIMTSVYSERKFADYLNIILLIWKEIIQRKEVDFLKYESVVMDFINGHCCLSLENFQLCVEQKIPLRDDTRELFFYMINEYEAMIQKFMINLDFKSIGIIIESLENFYKIISFYPQVKITYYSTISELIKLITQFYSDLLCRLPLNNKKYKIGIFGVGKHTEGLLSIYEKIIGTVNCKLVFIDSFKKNESYRNEQVISFQDIDESFDFIIISSKQYEKEMERNIRSVNEKISIFTFYDIFKKDIFSKYDIFFDFSV